MRAVNLVRHAIIPMSFVLLNGCADSVTTYLSAVGERGTAVSIRTGGGWLSKTELYFDVKTEGRTKRVYLQRFSSFKNDSMEYGVCFAALVIQEDRKVFGALVRRCDRKAIRFAYDWAHEELVNFDQVQDYLSHSIARDYALGQGTDPVRWAMEDENAVVAFRKKRGN